MKTPRKRHESAAHVRKATARRTTASSCDRSAPFTQYSRFPCLYTWKVGIDVTPAADAISSSSSKLTSTLTKRAAGYFPASSAKKGAIFSHGAHLGLGLGLGLES